jgi:dTDP-4-dehydrorhamnose 3,5-epimerase
MHIEQTGIPGLVILTPARFGDARGFFSETWNRARLSENGIDIDFVQDNHSLSAAVGTVRGLHFQAPPHAQAKLVRCGRGALFDVAVDIRKGSPTYGRWFGIELSFENGKQLLMIPAGFRPWFRDAAAGHRDHLQMLRHLRARDGGCVALRRSRYRHRLGPWRDAGDPVGQGRGGRCIRGLRQPLHL